jgi:hypothetical protein
MEVVENRRYGKLDARGAMEAVALVMGYGKPLEGLRVVYQEDKQGREYARPPPAPQ